MPRRSLGYIHLERVHKESRFKNQPSSPPRLLPHIHEESRTSPPPPSACAKIWHFGSCRRRSVPYTPLSKRRRRGGLWRGIGGRTRHNLIPCSDRRPQKDAQGRRCRPPNGPRKRGATSAATSAPAAQQSMTSMQSISMTSAWTPAPAHLAAQPLPQSKAPAAHGPPQNNTMRYSEGGCGSHRHAQARF